MEILLANNSAFPDPVAVRGQAAGLVPKPPDISSGGDVGGVSPGCGTAFGLGMEVSASQWHSSAALPVLAEPGSPRRTWPGQELSPALTYGREKHPSAFYLRGKGNFISAETTAAQNCAKHLGLT